MQIDFVTLILGMALAGAGWLLAGHARVCLQQCLNAGSADLEESGMRSSVRRHRRRFQSSVLMILLGLLIVCTDVLPLLTSSVYAASIYVTAILSLALWLLILGILDGVQSMRQFSGAAGTPDADRIRGMKRLREGTTGAEGIRSNSHTDT